MDKHKLHDEIARVAYFLYERRGKLNGYAEQDWIEAERIVMAQFDVPAQKPAEPKKVVRKKQTAAPKEEPAKPAKKPAAKKRTVRKKEE